MHAAIATHLGKRNHAFGTLWSANSNSVWNKTTPCVWNAVCSNSNFVLGQGSITRLGDRVQQHQVFLEKVKHHTFGILCAAPAAQTAVCADAVPLGQCRSSLYNLAVQLSTQQAALSLLLDTVPWWQYFCGATCAVALLPGLQKLARPSWMLTLMTFSPFLTACRQVLSLRPFHLTATGFALTLGSQRLQHLEDCLFDDSSTSVLVLTTKCFNIPYSSSREYYYPYCSDD